MKAAQEHNFVSEQKIMSSKLVQNGLQESHWNPSNESLFRTKSGSTQKRDRSIAETDPQKWSQANKREKDMKRRDVDLDLSHI